MTRFALAALLTSVALGAHAAPVTFVVSGTARVDAGSSNLGSATGQAIRSALDGQAGQWSMTIDPSVADSDPSADVLDLRGGITASSINIAGIGFGAALTPCLNLDFDCRATMRNNAFADSDSQFLSSQVLNSPAFRLSDLTFFFSTTGVGLFDAPEVVDPLSGLFSGGMSVFFFDQELQVVRFSIELDRSAAVPVPGSLPLAGLGLAVLAAAARQRRR